MLLSFLSPTPLTNMQYWFTFLFVMVAVTIADVCWTMYFIETEKRNAVKAGVWSAMIMVAGAFTTTKYVDDRSFIIAAVIGAFLGTAGIIEWKRRQEEKSKI